MPTNVYTGMDGSISVAEALRPYMRGVERIGPPET